MKLVEKINNKFERGFAKEIFDHIRNLLICTFILAIGTNQLQEKNEIIFSVSQGKYVGFAVIAISIILIIINTWDGIRVIFNTKLNFPMTCLLIFLYLIIVVKVLLVGWDFRVLPL